ncbi:MAG: helix-turn-helix domain-containing protein [Bryobacteraceae bacterium]
MNAQMAVRSDGSIMLGRTSSDGMFRRVQDLLISIAGALATTGTTSGEPQDLRSEESIGWEQTNSGMALADTTPTLSAVLAELRRRSGLTWDQLARLCGVSRRSVHLWASGEKPSGDHQERLMRLVETIRYVDRGSAPSTRAALITPLGSGAIPFDLLMQGNLDELKRQLGVGTRRSIISLSPLTASARLARTPIPPSGLVDALQNSVHREAGKTRAARTVKTSRER